ncbi:MAG: DUF2721 domain-containing protein [bacterium]
MTLTLSTPALLFPAISVLVLAYTNKFIAISRLTRELHNKYQDKPDEVLYAQLNTLRRRIIIIRNMQAIGVAGFLFCILCMIMVYAELIIVASLLFAISLGLVGISLCLSLVEIFLSGKVLMIQLDQSLVKKN